MSDNTHMSHDTHMSQVRAHDAPCGRHVLRPMKSLKKKKSGDFLILLVLRINSLVVQRTSLRKKSGGTNLLLFEFLFNMSFIDLKQGGKDPQNALSCKSFSAKEPLITGLFCGK